ncbi:MAG TPA: response regulator transcription factor [Gemmatimonadales bacterium]|nr:response regulator transcription factor [Gemmatimonadales bacterium]
MSRILIIEDNPRLAEGLVQNLEIEGHRVTTAIDATRGLALAQAEAPDLIILDLMLPDRPGLMVLRELRESGCRVPILVLTALGEEEDKVRGLRLGADDYVAKPFGLLELLARVEALLRRARSDGTAPPGRLIRTGDLVIDCGTHAVTKRGTPIELRPREYQLLEALLRREGRVASRLELLQEVWGYHPEVSSRTVDTHVAELRRKLEEDPAKPRYIITVRKAGYRIEL